MAHTLDLSNVEAISSDCGIGGDQINICSKKKKKGLGERPSSNIQGEPQNAEVNPYQGF